MDARIENKGRREEKSEVALCLGSEDEPLCIRVTRDRAEVKAVNLTDGA